MLSSLGISNIAEDMAYILHEFEFIENISWIQLYNLMQKEIQNCGDKYNSKQYSRKNIMI